MIRGQEPSASAAGERVGAGERDHRVLIVTDFFYPHLGGTERLAESAAVALMELGMEVEVATRALPDRTELRYRGITIHEIDAEYPDWLAGRSHGLRRVVDAGRYDSLLVFGDPGTWPLLVATSLPKPRPRVVVVPCVKHDKHAALRSAPEKLEAHRMAMDDADLVCVSSLAGFDRRLAVEIGINAAYVPNAVEEVSATPGFRQRHGLDAGAPLLLTVAQFRTDKNHLGLLAAFADAPSDWQLVIAGGEFGQAPELAQEIRQVAATDPRVRLLGPLSPEEIPAAMAEADLLLLPSIAEATPLVILEAMQSRLPWLATPTCGAVSEWAGGVVAPLESFVAVSSGLLGDSDLRSRLGAAGRQHWESCYTWDVVGRRYARALRGEDLPVLRSPTEPLRLTRAISAQVRRQTLPTVTCVITAYNYESYVRAALASVLDQTYPKELLDIVVVDDGSSDATADIVEDMANSHPGRIRLIRRENGGLAAATQTALDAATGELLAICDADDVWFPDKVAQQVAVFVEDPTVQLVYGDMVIVGSEGETLAPSFFVRTRLMPHSGDVLALVADVNFTTNSTLMWRAGAVPPIPAASPYADYWVVMHAAARGSVRGLSQVLGEYRQHGENMGFGSAPGTQRYFARTQRLINFRRLIFSSMAVERLSPTAVRRLAKSIYTIAAKLAESSGEDLEEILAVSDEQRAAAAEIAVRTAASGGDPAAQTLAYARAFALDPQAPALQERLIGLQVPA
jgi:glycosyltransferase involved in cell wall biosynthesis